MLFALKLNGGVVLKDGKRGEDGADATCNTPGKGFYTLTLLI